MYRLATLILFAIVVATFPVLAQVSDPALGGGEASLEGLGDLPGGEFDSRAHAVSADGSVVVGVGESSRGTEAFRWENGVMEGLGDLEDPEVDDFSSYAFDVSADGEMVFGGGISFFFEAFRWEDGVMEGLGDLESDCWIWEAKDASSDGTVVIGHGTNPENGNHEACRWENGNIEALGFLEEGDYSKAEGISSDGTVVIGFSTRTASGVQEAFRWEDGTMEGLGFLEGAEASRAEDVSADGRVVVGRNNFYKPFQWEAFRWEDGVMEGLGDLHGPLSGSVAHAVSADGSVIVGEAGYHSEDGVRVFIWTEEEGMRYLHEVLENDYDLDITGWSLRRAYDVTVTSDGTVVVVGHGRNPEGNVSEAFRAVLPNAGQPVAGIMPESFAFEVEEGESHSDVLTIGNMGTADLEWSIAGDEIWFDNFDDYELGSNIHGQGGWKGWGNNPEFGAPVSADVSRSTPHSVKIENPSELVHEFDELGIDSGQWTIKAWQFIPNDFNTSHDTFFFLQNDYDDSGINNMSTVVQFRRFDEGPQNFFRAFNAGISGGSLPVATGEWIELRVEIDLDADTQEFWYGDALLFSGTWTDEYGDGSLSFDTISLIGSGQSPVYYDDLSITLSDCKMPGVSWLSVDPASGTTAPGESSENSVMVNAEGLEPSEEPYTANLCVATNDPERQVTAVPVSLTVLPSVGTEENVDFEGPYHLAVVTPNPASETTTITLQVKRAQDILVEVFDVNGRRVAVPFEETVAARNATDIVLNVSSLATGVYVMRVAGKDFVDTRRITVVR